MIFASPIITGKCCGLIKVAHVTMLLPPMMLFSRLLLTELIMAMFIMVILQLCLTMIAASPRVLLHQAALRPYQVKKKALPLCLIGSLTKDMEPQLMTRVATKIMVQFLQEEATQLLSNK